MSERARGSSDPKIRLQRDETFKIDGHQDITCYDIGRLAWSMYEKSYFFSMRRGLKCFYSRDINGSGEQMLEITRSENDQRVLRIIFDVSYREGESYIYEAELIKDQRKDYMPSVNHGKRSFLATRAEMYVDWNCEEVDQWRFDLDRLSVRPETLEGWVEAGLDMIVSCRSSRMCMHTVVLSPDDLAKHAVAGISVNEFQKRLVCSRCRKRTVRLSPL